MSVPREPRADTQNLLLRTGVQGHRNAANITNRALQRINELFPSPELQTGIVVRCGVGMYDALVRTSRHTALPCVQLSMQTYAAGFGTAEARLLPEGTPVLVLVSASRAAFGLIISAGTALYLGKDDQRQAHIYELDPEPGAAEWTEQAYKEPHVDKLRMGIVPANSGRAIDLMPGNVAWHNEVGVSMGVLNSLAFLRGSNRCKIEAYMLDDLLRLVYGQLQQFGPLGEHQEYNDYGYNTGEWGATPHQCEAQGHLQYGQPLTKTVDPDKEKAKQANEELIEPRLLAHKRMQVLTGFLGGMFRMYVQAPDPAIATNTYNTRNKDRGLAHLGVDASGRILIQSAGDIVLERFDRIPVPKKLAEAYDPSGLHADSVSPTAREPFQWSLPTEYLSHPLELRDAMWWAHKSYDQHLNEFSTMSEGEDGLDWYFPEVAEMPVPENLYDKILGDVEDYASYDKRTAQVVLRQDGGISLREHDGAEIQLVAGKVIISAPEGVEIRSGKNIVNLAQEDVVIKGRQSVDINATEKDVRLKAEGNIQAYADRGIVLEADGGMDHGLYPSSQGEDVVGGGVSLLARNGRVFNYGRIVHHAAKSQIYIETLENETGGTVVVSSDLFVSTAERQVHLSDAGTGWVARGDTSYLIGESTLMVANRSAAIFKGTQFAPTCWKPMDENPYPDYAEIAVALYERYKESTSWLKPYDPPPRPDMYYTHRTTEQYGLTGPLAKVYESLWAYRGRKGASVPKDPWAEHPTHDTWPWPGEAHYAGSSFYYELVEEKNVADATTNIPKNRNSRSPSSGGFTGKSFHAYIG